MAAKKQVSPLEAIISRLRVVSAEKEGKGIIEAVASNEAILSEVSYVLKVGNDPWDDMTGSFPVGRIVEIFGLESCGKTALMWLAAFKAKKGEIYKRTRTGNVYKYEKLDPKTYNVEVLYIDNEHSLESNTIEVGGESVPIGITRCETVESIFKSIDECIKTLAKIEDDTGILQFFICIVDTIAGTATKEELAQAWDKDDYSRRPKQLQEGFRNLAQTISRRNACIICVNQVGDQFGYQAPKGPRSSEPDWRAFSPPGGKALKFWSTLRVFMWQCTNNYKLVKDDRFQAGLMVGFKTVKNRLLAPFRGGRLVILFDRNGNGGIRADFSLLESLIYYKLAEEDDDRNIVFKFKKNGVEPSTFPDLMKTFSEQAEDGKKERYKDPRISSRASWPKFYLEHKADFDALWQKAVEMSRTITGIDGEVSEGGEVEPETETETEPGESHASDDDGESSDEERPRKRRGGRNPLADLVGKV